MTDTTQPGDPVRSKPQIPLLLTAVFLAFLRQ